MNRRLAECARHRDALDAVVDDAPMGSPRVSALDHLGRCPACRREAEGMALAVFALRRLGAEAETMSATVAGAAAAAGPTGIRDEAWPALRARVSRRRTPAWRWRSQVAGVLLGAGLVAAVIGPTSVHSVPGPGLDEAGALPGQTIDPTRQDIRGEEAWMRAVDRARKEGPIEPVATAVRVDPRIFGDEALPQAVTSQPGHLRNAR
jgi:hypothetical protein